MRENPIRNLITLTISNANEAALLTLTTKAVGQQLKKFLNAEQEDDLIKEKGVALNPCI